MEVCLLISLIICYKTGLFSLSWRSKIVPPISCILTHTISLGENVSVAFETWLKPVRTSDHLANFFASSCWKQLQVESVTGAVHLSNDSASVPRPVRRDQHCRVMGLCWGLTHFSVRASTMTASPINSFGVTFRVKCCLHSSWISRNEETVSWEG